MLFSVLCFVLSRNGMMHKISFSTELALFTMPILRFGCLCLLLFGFCFAFVCFPLWLFFLLFGFSRWHCDSPQDSVVGPQPYDWVHQCAVVAFEHNSIVACNSCYARCDRPDERSFKGLGFCCGCFAVQGFAEAVQNRSCSHKPFKETVTRVIQFCFQKPFSCTAEAVRCL